MVSVSPVSPMVMTRSIGADRPGEHEIGRQDVRREDDPVDVVARGERVGHVVDGVVVPAAAPQIGVALVAALQTIVAGAAVEHVLAQEAVNVVVAGGLCRREDQIHDLVVGHDGFVGELEGPDAVEPDDAEGARGKRFELLLHPQHLAGAERDHQIVGRAVAGENGVFAQDTVAEDDLVLHPAEDVVSRVVHRVGAVAETEDMDVVLVAADQRVVAEAAVEKVLVGKAVDGVVALRARRNECLDDFFPREIGAIGEGKDFDPIEPLLAKGTGVGRSELISVTYSKLLNFKPVLSVRPLSLKTSICPPPDFELPR